ncbi:MAG: hypothetical protein AAGN46_01605 [Acidobacteriota bacterium]
MLIRTTRRDSKLAALSDDPNVELAIGSEQELPATLITAPIAQLGTGSTLFKIDPKLVAAREKLTGQRIKLADLGFSVADKTLIATGLDVPSGADAFFTTTACVLSGFSTYHALTREEPKPLEIAISSAATVAAMADLVAPFLPALREYRPYFDVATLVLKGLDATQKTLEISTTVEELEALERPLQS